MHTISSALRSGFPFIALSSLFQAALADGETYYSMVYGPGTHGNDVTILIQNNSVTPFGLYTNGGTGANLTVGDRLTIVVGAFDDADGIRTNPSGSSNWSGASSVITIGNDLSVTTNGNSGDCINLNGYCEIEIGDGAQFTTNGGYKATYSEGAHGLRTNYAAQITVGKNAVVETNGGNSHGIYAATGNDTTGTNPATSTITLGDNATIRTTGGGNLLGGSYGAYVQAANGAIIFKGTSDISTKGASSYAVYANGTNSEVEMGGKATISTEGNSSHGVYARGSSSTVDMSAGSSVTTTGQDAHGIYSAGTSSNIKLGGVTQINNSGSGSHSIYATGGKVVGTGKFILDNAAHNASLYASSGTIDLEMSNASSFKGYTVFSSGTATGKIYLSLEDSTNWTLSQSSELSTLSTDATSSITFSLYGQNDYTKILARESADIATGSLMEVVLNGYNPIVGDAFQLIAVKDGATYTAGTASFDFSRAVLAPGLIWDTSTFSLDGTIRVIAGIPEPSAGLLALFVVGPLFRRRRTETR